MRCGRELKEDKQVFCPDCQSAMESCPVPPGTVVHLPARSPASPAKKKAVSRKKELKPEEQIAKLRAANRWLTFALVITVLAFALTAALLIYTLDEPELPLGRNYTAAQAVDGK
jgi:hypothetical protein